MHPSPLIGLVLACCASSGATHGAPVSAPHVVSELVARTRGVAPGSTVTLALAQTLDKGWHTYWRNPGDAGEATRISWTLPGGWRAGEIVWPAPRRFPLGPIMNYGYDGALLLPVPVAIPASAPIGRTVTIKAVAQYLVCADVCIPGSVTLDLTLPVVAAPAAADPRWGPAIDAALAAAPKPGGLEATFRSEGGKLRLAVAGASLTGTGDANAYFYPYAEDVIDHAAPQGVERGSRGLTLTLAPGSAFARGAQPAALAGVLESDGRAVEIVARPGPPPAGSAGLGSPPTVATTRGAGGIGGLVFASLSALVGGLILNLMPCVFPILSMKAAALADHSGRPMRARAQGLAFLAGVLASFLALASALLAARAAGQAVGWGFQLQTPWVVAALALTMLAAGLNLSGVFEIGTSAQGLGAGVGGRGALASATLTGALAVIVAAPCTAPFMGPALGYALTQPPAAALIVFLCLGVGFAAPFTLIAFSPALTRRLPRPGPWMDGLRKALAFPMYAAAAWLAWVLAQQSGPGGLAGVLAAAIALALAAWLFGVAQRGRAAGRPVRLALSAAALSAVAAFAAVGAGAAAPGSRTALTGGALAAQPYTPERLAALRATGRPVLVNFTAAWCVTCQVNERLAFAAPEVAAAFRRTGAAYLVADWTNRDATIARALADQGRIGVPLYLLYGSGAKAPRVLPQLLTPAVVAGALESTTS